MKGGIIRQSSVLFLFLIEKLLFEIMSFFVFIYDLQPLSMVLAALFLFVYYSAVSLLVHSFIEKLHNILDSVMFQPGLLVFAFVFLIIFQSKRLLLFNTLFVQGFKLIASYLPYLLVAERVLIKKNRSASSFT